MKKIIKQIAKEFWFPLILSFLWVLYNIYGGDTQDQWNVKKIVNVFGPTFFLLSWLTGQFFRVKKQTKVDDNFETMETKFKELLDRVEVKTEEMISHITGGNSFPWFQIGSINNNTNEGILMAVHDGEHPLYDVTARFVDLQKFEKIKDNISLETIMEIDINVNVGNMIPSNALMLQNWTLQNEPDQYYNIFITARNGSFTQSLRLKKINGVWTSATQVTTRGTQEVLLERIDENYPRNQEGEIVWE